MSEPIFTIAIVGAGVGGLMFAVALHKLCPDISVEIYEASRELAEIGAGIGIWPRDWKIIEALGLADDVLAIGGGAAPDARPFEYRKSDERAGFTVMHIPDRAVFTSFHRARFQAVLARHLPSTSRVSFAKRLVSHAVLPGDGVVLHFADGSEARCDVLVGCDGIRSAVRDGLCTARAEAAERAGDADGARRERSGIHPRWTGTVAYRALVPTAALLRASPGHPAAQQAIICLGKNKQIALYPIEQGKNVNIAAFVSVPEREGTTYDGAWVAPATTEDIVAAFSEWEPEVQSLLGCVREASLWSINTVSNLPSYVHGRVALVGDAAHAMAPYQGTGAGQAFEDAYVLASILAHPSVTRNTLSRALQAYDAVRRPSAQRALERSRETGMLYQLNGPEWKGVSAEMSAAGEISREILEEAGRKVEGLFNWLGRNSGSSVDEERDQAFALLEDIRA